MKFNAVGIAGAAVQPVVLMTLTQLQVQYLVAAAIAVETAILHNYFWLCVGRGLTRHHCHSLVILSGGFNWRMVWCR